MSLAQDVIDYLGTLPVTLGDHAGEPFHVLPWEARFIRGAWHPSVVGDAALSVARGNGKSGLVGGLAAACVDPVGPLHISRGEVVCVAASFQQSKAAIFEDVVAAMRAKYGELNRKTWKVQDSVNHALIEHKPTGARVRCIGAKPRTAHGLKPRLILADEPAQWETGQADAMEAALRTGLGKIPGSRMIVLGTRPADGSHFFSKMLAGAADYSQSHAARPDSPPFQRRTWKRANPSLDHFPSLEARIRREAKDAKADPAKLAEFKALRLNMGCPDTLQALLLSAETWERIEGDSERRGPYILGLDLGGSAAMSGAAGYFMESGALDAFAVFPELPSLAERGLLDGVGRRYCDMAGRKELMQAGRRVSDIPALLRESLKRWGAPLAVVCDRWREDELRDKLEDVNFPRCDLVIRGMGFKDGGEDVRRFREGCLGGHVTPVQSLLLRSCMSEARVQIDPAGNAKLQKGAGNGRKLNARDDAVAASILAVAEGMRRGAASYKPKTRRLYFGTVN